LTIKGWQQPLIDTGITLQTTEAPLVIQRGFNKSDCWGYQPLAAFGQPEQASLFALLQEAFSV
jgi:hypothetical protein